MAKLPEAAPTPGPEAEVEAPEIKYPAIVVSLVARESNQLALIGKVQSAMRRGGASKKDLAAFVSECMATDQHGLLKVMQRWVSVE